MQMTQQYIVYASAAPVDLIAILSRELDPWKQTDTEHIQNKKQWGDAENNLHLI